MSLAAVTGEVIAEATLNPVGFANSHFLFPLGLYALLALIPLVILYLIRPKPKKKIVPALMFLLKEKEKSMPRSLFRTFIKDWIFLLQFLIILILALAIARPFVNVPEEIFVDETVIIIDASASSQAVLGARTRFHKQVEIAMEELSKDNTIILATHVPQIVVEHVGSNEAERALESITPFDTETNLYESILAAANYLGDKGRVVVISDFTETADGPGYEIAVEMLESRGLDIVTHNIVEGWPEARNVGIIGLDVNEERFTIQVKNFMDESIIVGVRVNEKPDVETYLNISANSIESFTMKTPPSTTKVEIEPNDDFRTDDIVWVSAPEKERIDILHVTNHPNPYMSAALSVIEDLVLETVAPPKSFSIERDIIVVVDVDKDKLLPGTISSLKKQVKKGMSIILFAQEGLFDLGFEDLLPVKYEGMGEGSAILAAEELTFTRDVNFGYSSKYFIVKAEEDAQVIVEDEFGNPVIVLKREGEGYVVYYGLFDEDSDFKMDMYYPIFWKRLFDFLIDKPDIKKLNRKTGEILNLGSKQNLETPFGNFKDSSIMLNKAGLYKSELRTYASNLINEQESNLNGVSETGKSTRIEEDVMEIETPFELSHYVLIIAMILLFLELLWIKLRGDL